MFTPSDAVRNRLTVWVDDGSALDGFTYHNHKLRAGRDVTIAGVVRPLEDPWAVVNGMSVAQWRNVLLAHIFVLDALKLGEEFTWDEVRRKLNVSTKVQSAVARPNNVKKDLQPVHLASHSYGKALCLVQDVKD